jgi:hypothetical protein
MPALSLFLAGSPGDAVADVRRQRRVDYLHRLEAGIGDAVEERLPGAEQDGDEIEDELVDHPCGERLAHGGCAASNVTPLSPAASDARAKAASKPSVTKWNVVPPAILTGCRS